MDEFPFLLCVHALVLLVFTGMNACLGVYISCVHTVKARRGHRITTNWSYRQSGSTMRMLGTEPGPLKEQEVLLTSEGALQPQPHLQLERATKPFLGLHEGSVWPHKCPPPLPKLMLVTHE